jgi:hypothetical protein
MSDIDDADKDPCREVRQSSYSWSYLLNPRAAKNEEKRHENEKLLSYYYEESTKDGGIS